MRKKIAFLISVVTVFLLVLPLTVFAAGDSTLTSKDKEGHTAIVQDDAGLFSKKEREALLKQITELLPYGSIGIATSEESNRDIDTLIKNKYIDLFGDTNGTLFLIDMYNRRIQFFTHGDLYKTLNTTRTNEITDNIYTYLSKGDYYEGTKRAFEQVQAILSGGRIVTPMRYATNAALAIGVVLLINFLILAGQRKRDKNANKLISSLHYTNRSRNTSVVQGVRSVMTRQSKTRHASSSGSGFSGGGGGFSGGGGGGGFSGGGGGHSF